MVFKYLDEKTLGAQLLSAEYFHQMNPYSHLAQKGLSRSSFCEARKKISWEAFAFLFSQVPKSHNKTWKGHTLRAVDGTKLTLPRSEEILKSFPVQESSFGSVHYPYAYMFSASHVLTGQITHSMVGDKHLSERESLKELLSQFSSGDMALLDRGFYGKSIWLEFNKNNQYFLGRFTTTGRLPMKEFSPQKKDQLITVTDKKTNESMQIRVVRGVRLRNGEYIYLVTNLLDEKKYKRRELLNLYKERQVIETNFLELKTTLKLNPITHLKKLNHVLQEIYAALLTQSLVAFNKARVKVKEGKRVSFKAIKRLLRINLSWEMEVDRLDLNEIGRFYSHIHQPGRAYPRYSRRAESKWIKEKRNVAYRKRKQTLRG